MLIARENELTDKGELPFLTGKVVFSAKKIKWSRKIADGSSIGVAVSYGLLRRMLGSETRGY